MLLSFLCCLFARLPRCVCGRSIDADAEHGDEHQSKRRAHPDLKSTALTTELCTHVAKGELIHPCSRNHSFALDMLQFCGKKPCIAIDMRHATTYLRCHDKLTSRRGLLQLRARA